MENAKNATGPIFNEKSLVLAEVLVVLANEDLVQSGAYGMLRQLQILLVQLENASEEQTSKRFVENQFNLFHKCLLVQWHLRDITIVNVLYSRRVIYKVDVRDEGAINALVLVVKRTAGLVGDDLLDRHDV